MVQKIPLTSIDKLDAMFISISAVEYLNIKLKPYEVVIVNSERQPPFPPKLIVGGPIEKGEDVFSLASSEKRLAVVLQTLNDYNARGEQMIVKLGILAEYFIFGKHESIHEGALAISKILAKWAIDADRKVLG